MKNLITGGAGFVGSHLTERYLKDGHSVTVIDNCKTGRFSNLNFLKNSYNLDVVEDDLTEMDELVLEDLIINSDLIYHLASTVGVELVDTEPKLTAMSNLQTAMTLLPLIEKHKKKLIFTSTSEVYGSKESGSF